MRIFTVFFGYIRQIMKRLLVLFLFCYTLGSLFAQSAADSVSGNPNSYTTKTGDIITQPEFKGGVEKMYEYISRNFIYPEEAKKRSVIGKMEVEFTVEKSGAITYVSVLKGLDESIDGEIVKLLEAMPRWTPATKNGVPVRYKVSMPINLRASRKGQKSNQDLMRYDEE